MRHSGWPTATTVVPWTGSATAIGTRSPTSSANPRIGSSAKAAA